MYGRRPITGQDIVDCMKAAAQGYAANEDEEKSKIWYDMARRFRKKHRTRVTSSDRRLRRTL